MRVVNEEACDSLTASLRHIAVHVSGVVEADVRRVWEAVREFGAVSKWLPAAEASVLKVLLQTWMFCGFTERPPPITTYRAALLVSLKNAIRQLASARASSSFGSRAEGSWLAYFILEQNCQPAPALPSAPVPRAPGWLTLYLSSIISITRLCILCGPTQCTERLTPATRTAKDGEGCRAGCRLSSKYLHQFRASKVVTVVARRSARRSSHRGRRRTACRVP